MFKYFILASITFQYRSIKDFAPIEARFTFKRDGKHISIYTRTRISVSKSFWDEYKEGVNFRDAAKANLKKEVGDQAHQLEEHILNEYHNASDMHIGKDWLINAVRHFYTPPEKPEGIPTDLIGYWKYYLDLRKHELEDKIRSFQKWVTVMNKLDRMQKSLGREYQIKDVNEGFKKDYTQYCKGEKYSNYTITKEFSYIKTVCIHARGKGLEVSRELDSLKLKLKLPPTPKVYLSFDEIHTIEQVKGLPEYLDNVRDWLIISCYTGQRISDFMRFEKSMIRESKGKPFIDVKQVKTGKVVTIPLLPEVIRVLDKRAGNFPRAISHQKYNDWIKEVCKKAGLNKMTRGGVRINNRQVLDEYPKWQLVTSHIGRRSYATNYYGKIATSFLKDITGHGTERMLLAYVGKSSKDTAFEAYDLLLNAK